jgi:Cu2+-exporting ATPase
MGQASVVDIIVADKSAVQEAALALGVRLPPQLLLQQKSQWAKEAQLLLGAAAAVALESPHPLSTAVRRAAVKESLVLPESACRGEERHAESGRGIRALAPDGSELRLGSPEWIDAELGLTNSITNAVSAAASSRQAGRSIISLAVGDDYCGCIALEDEVRPGAKATIDRLKSLGLRVLIASGDNAGAVLRAAKAVGINEEDAHSALSPEGKVELVRSLQKGENAGNSSSSSITTTRVGKVLFVGDGVNDAAALTMADVGVAVQGSTASSAAAAGALLQRDDLDGVADIIYIGRAARTLIAINFGWAALYNLIAMPLAAGALYPITGAVTIPLALAGLSEALSTLPVVGGALALWLVAPVRPSSTSIS